SATVARAKRAVRDDGGVVRAGARWGSAAIRGEIRGKAHPLAERFEHSDVERRALAGPFTAQQRRENRGEGIHPGGDVRDRDARLARRLGGAGDRKQSCFALHQQVVGLLARVRPARAVAGYRSEERRVGKEGRAWGESER